MPANSHLPWTPTLYLLLCFSFFSSCNPHTNKQEAIFIAMDQVMERTNQVLDRENEMIMYAIKEKLYDPATAEKAEIWHPRSEAITKYSNDLINELRVVEAKLNNHDRLSKADSRDLNERLEKYKHNVLAIDSSIWNEFRTNLVLVTKHFDSSTPADQDLFKTFFDATGKEGSRAMLQIIENNIRIIQNKLISYCNAHLFHYVGHYYS